MAAEESDGDLVNLLWEASSERQGPGSVTLVD